MKAILLLILPVVISYAYTPSKLEAHLNSRDVYNGLHKGHFYIRSKLVKTQYITAYLISYGKCITFDNSTTGLVETLCGDFIISNIDRIVPLPKQKPKKAVKPIKVKKEAHKLRNALEEYLKAK